jgi:isopentenyldiphosphate isomerase
MQGCGDICALLDCRSCLALLPHGNRDGNRATRWATRDALRAEARADPARFAPWFAIYLERWAELGQ